MKIKTSELIGPALNWAVEFAKGTCWINGYFIYGKSIDPNCRFSHKTEAYSTDWSQAGPIIEREGIQIFKHNGATTWSGVAKAPRSEGYTAIWCPDGPTPLIAAMRAFVASKLGDEIEVPDELTE